ncbi:hypothetical protein P879_04606 [Paragonimus westermani]|uniref:Mannosyltransferase n=1 Tax=Paragonimus westermani TaxID=34504 RepID=A0A8T0DMX0_9TREM|nr:hypothetical protein P879_04606 [Paragonimus westermani]
MCALIDVYSLFRSDKRLFVVLLCYRVLNTLLIQTAFVPDEFWQSVEVAHNWTFGYGSLTWEWWPEVALRSPIYPLVFSTIYYLSSWVGIDSRGFILLVPRMLHAVLAALTDLHLYRLASVLSGPIIAKWTLFHQVFNWFTFFCAPRTLANSVEWALTVIGLANFPWQIFCEAPIKQVHSWTDGRFVFAAVVCCLIRPTATLIWIPVCLFHLYHSYRLSSNKRASKRLHQSSLIATVTKIYCFIGITSIVFSCLLDRVYFGHWTINQWNFVRFNLLTDGSHVYGVHSWHWYLSNGVPAMLWTQVPFTLIGMFISWTCDLSSQHTQQRKGVNIVSWSHSLSTDVAIRSSRFLCVICVWTFFCYSLLGHKEFRFLFPLLPLLMYFCGIGTNWLVTRIPSQRWITTTRCLALFVVFTHFPLALYTSLIHQRGTLDALSALHKTIVHGKFDLPQNIRITALMPCHSIPSVGYMHLNVSFDQLACDPDLTGWFDGAQGHLDEADHFYLNPTAWLLNKYKRSVTSRPHFIVMFTHLFEAYPSVRNLLMHQWDYHECGRYFHAHFLTHSKHGNYVFQFGFFTDHFEREKCEHDSNTEYASEIEKFTLDDGIKDIVHLPHLTYEIQNFRQIKYVSGKALEEYLNDTTVRNGNLNYSGVDRAVTSGIDVIPGIIEGGFTVWDGSKELISSIFSRVSTDLFQNRRILELGCGCGLPGIAALLGGASLVTFQDYNREVLRRWTIPNVLLNMESVKHDGRSVEFYSGDWLHIAQLWESTQHPKYDIILTAETIYRPDLYERLLRIIKAALLPDGSAFLLTKSTYAPGGCLYDFLDAVGDMGIFRTDIQEIKCNGVVQFLVQIKWT